MNRNTSKSATPRTNSNPSESSSSVGYTVQSARTTNRAASAVNSRLSSTANTKRSSMRMEEDEDDDSPKPPSALSSSSRQPVSSSARIPYSSKVNAKKTVVNPFDDEEEEEEEDYWSNRNNKGRGGEMSNTYSNRSNPTSTTMKNAKKDNPFDDDDAEEEDKPLPVASSVRTKNSTVTQTKPVPKKNQTNPFENEEDENSSPTSVTTSSKNYVIPTSSKPNRFAFYDASTDITTKDNATVSTSTASNSKANSKNPFMDDDEISNKISSYQKSKVSSSSSINNNKKTYASSIATTKSGNSKGNPFSEDDEEENDDDDEQEEMVDSVYNKKISQYKKSTNSTSSSSSHSRTYTSNRNVYPSSSSKMITTTTRDKKPTLNPFMEEEDEDENEDNYQTRSSYPKKTATTNPFHDDDDDDDDDVEQGTMTEKSNRMKNQGGKANPFDSEEEEEYEVKETYMPPPSKRNTISSSSSTTTTFQSTRNNKSKVPNPFEDSEEDEEEEHGDNNSKYVISSKSTQNNPKNTKANPFDSDDEEDEDDDIEKSIPSKYHKKSKNSPTTTVAASDIDIATHDKYNDYEEDFEQEEEYVRTKNSSKNCLLRFAFALCPRLAPLHPAMFLFLTLAVFIPAIGYVIAFTKVGYGNIVFFYLTHLFQNQAWIFAISIGGYCLLLYIFDVEYWTSRVGKWTRSLVFIILLLAMGTFLLFVSGETPYGPIALFTVVVPIWMMILRSIFFRKVPPRVYVSWLGLPMFFVSILIGIGWIYWTNLGNDYKWTLYIRISDNLRMGCKPDFTNHPECQRIDNSTGLIFSNTTCFSLDIIDRTVVFPSGCKHSCVNDVYSACTSTFIIWVGPLLVTVSLFFLSFFTTFLRPNNKSGDIYKFARLWIFLLFALWVAASLAGIAQGIVTTLAALTLASLIASMILLINSTTKDERETRMNELMSTADEKFGNYFDIGRGLLVIVAAPIIALFLALSCFVQLIRVINPFTCFCKPTRREKNRHDEDYKFKFITTQADRQIRAFLKWDRVRVFKWAIYWGIAFMSLNVLISKFTILFLAWLINELKKSSLEAVTFIMIGVGIVLFLLPPVPGVPIYLTVGIVIPAVGGDDLTLVGSVGYATGICFVMRQIALAIQLKMGVGMRHFVSVRKLCAINSTVVRAATVILKDKWPTMAKCCALIGLPEWPIATMCGVLNLSLLSIQVATIPVVILILPTVMTGTFLYMSSILKSDGDPKYPSSTTLAAILAVATALVQFGSMIIAAYYVGQVMETRKSDVDAIPIDEDVQASEEKDKLHNQVYQEATKWSNVPWYMKIILILAVILMIACCYLVQLYQSYCFADFELTSTIEVDLQGDWTKIVKPYGALAILLFFLSCLLLIIFSVWASMKTSKMKKGDFTISDTPKEGNGKGKKINIKDLDPMADKDGDVEERRVKTKHHVNPFEEDDDAEEEEVTPKMQNIKTVSVSKMNPFEDDEEENGSKIKKSKVSPGLASKRNPFNDDDDDEKDYYDEPHTVSSRSTYPSQLKSTKFAREGNPLDDEENEDVVSSIPPSLTSKQVAKQSDNTVASNIYPVPSKPKRYAFYDANETKDVPPTQPKAVRANNTITGNKTNNPFSDENDEEEEYASSNKPSQRSTKFSSSKGVSNSQKPNSSKNPFHDDGEDEEESIYENKMNLARTSPFVHYSYQSKSNSSYPTSASTKTSSNPFMDESDNDDRMENESRVNIGTTNPFHDDDGDDDEEQVLPHTKSRGSKNAKSNPFDSEDDEEQNYKPVKSSVPSKSNPFDSDDDEKGNIVTAFNASKAKSNPFDSEEELEEVGGSSSKAKVSKPSAEPPSSQKPQKKSRFSRRGKT